MKTPLCLILFFYCAIGLVLCANSIEYHYDAAGNRISRQVCLLRSAVIENQEDSISDPPILSHTAQGQIRIAPNPTHGLLHVSINTQGDGTDKTSKELRLLLYSAEGALLQDHKTLDREMSLNLFTYPPGHYILKVFLADTRIEFKIVKQ